MSRALKDSFEFNEITNLLIDSMSIDCVTCFKILQLYLDEVFHI